jgi:TolA-binding protein
MRELSHAAPQLPPASTPSAPVMRANAADSLASSVAGPQSSGPRSTSPVAARAAGRRPLRRKVNRYGAMWAGVIAAAYAGAIVIGQEPLSTVAARWSAQDRDSTEVAAALARTQSEVAQLQRSVGALEADMGRVKTQATQVDTRERATTARIDAVESRVDRIGSQIAQVFAKASPAQKNAAATSSAATRSTGAAIETGALPSKETPPVPRELAALRHAPAEASVPQSVATQSVATQSVALQPAAPPAAAVLLARGPSLDALRLSWSLINERHKSALGALEPRVVTTEPGSYQLVAGPLASPAEAAKVCASLRARGVTCQPSEFKGDGL